MLQKFSSLFKTFIFIAKMRKPIVAKLIFLKKSGKLKRFKLLKHYNTYGFLEEYQFSASSTPLIPSQYRRVNYLKNNRSFQDFYSRFFFCKCFGEAEAAAYSPLKMEALPGVDEEGLELEKVHFEDEENDVDDDDSVDQRAEKFIEWFHQEMRMQRQDSI